MRIRPWGRAVVPTVLTAALTVVPSSVQAGPADGPDYEMPFPCGETWTGSTRYNHSPSVLSLDFNRPDDLGAMATSTAPGVVSSVVNLGNRGYGRYIVVDHGDGHSSLYAHLHASWATIGQVVDQGTPLGLVGSSGGSTGPHLHFEQRLDRRGQRVYFDRALFRAGSSAASQNCGDTPVVGDWDGNGTVNIGVLRRGSTPTFILKRPGRTPLRLAFGWRTDQAVSGDWDGDGTVDIGVRRPGLSAFVLRTAEGATRQVALGSPNDTGVTGDWDGDGRTEVGVWQPSTRVFTLRAANGSTRTVTLGALGDRPVTGDWNGDGRTDLGVYTAATSTFTLRTASASGSVTTRRVVWGSPTGLPVAGDWNKDKVGDVGVWDPATARFSLRLTPTGGATAVVQRRPSWGASRG